MTRPVLLRRGGSTLGVSYVGADELRAYSIPPRDVLHEDGFEIEAVLQAKPETNRFAFPLDGWEAFDFFYQPGLPNENPDGSRWGPSPLGGTRRQAVDVANSWAIYRKDDGTKAFHVYRPRITDANGATLWGTLEYADGVFTVEVPQEFLATATYPVVVDPTFGFTSAGASDDDPGGNLILVKASSTPASSGTLDSMTAWGRISIGSPLFNPAIYSDNAGVPNNRLGFVNSGGTAFTGSDSQITTNVPGSVAISSGVQYWLGLSTNFTGSTNDCNIKYDSGSGELYYGGATGNWPSSITGFTQLLGEKWSVYATYTAGGNVTINPTGFGLTTTQGSPAVVLVGNPTITPTGLSMTTSLGAPNVTASGSVTVSPSGLGMTTALGTFATRSDVTIDVTGFPLSANLGSFTIQNNITLTGIAGFGLAASVGVPSVVIASGITVHPTGQSISATLGTPTVVIVSNPTITPSGLQLTINRGTPSILISGSVTVAPVGMGMSADLGIPLLIITSHITPVGFGLSIGLGTPVVRVTTPAVIPPSPTRLRLQLVNTQLAVYGDDGFRMSTPIIFTVGETGRLTLGFEGVDGTVPDLSDAQSITFTLVNVASGVVKANAVTLTDGTSSGTAVWTRLAAQVDTPGDYLGQGKAILSDGSPVYFPDGIQGLAITLLKALGS